MASLTMRDPKGAIVPEDQGAYNAGARQPTTNLAPEKPPHKLVNSSNDDHFPPNQTGADSHQSKSPSHHQRFHAASADDQLTGCHRGSKVNSVSHLELWLQPNRSSNSSTSEVMNSHRFIPYFNPSKQVHSNTTLPRVAELERPSNKSSKPRKRTIILKPKCPKYEGLSNFAAPVDLVSDMIPSHNLIKQEKSDSPSLKSVPKLTGNKMSGESNTDSTNTDGHVPPEKNSHTPIDFLKYLAFEEWERRKQDLAQMVEDRKKLFLQSGFAETSGKPFRPDEQAIEKKPIPNRWVWYMHLSTDYDKLKNTRVPPGGPAGYLKYGWDRLGAAGKQPYQELTDIYSAQRLKYMAAHGITEENLKKKPKQVEKPKTHRYSPQELMIRADNVPAGFTKEPLGDDGKMTSLSVNESIDREISSQRPCFHIDMPFAPIQPILQYNLLYQQMNPFVHEKPNWNYTSGSAEIFEFTENTSYPRYLRSPEIISDDFSPFYNEAGYGSHFSSNTTQPQGTSLGLPSPPSKQAFSCDPSSMFPCQPPSEFQSHYALSPESINSANSEISGIYSNPCIENGSLISSHLGSLPLSHSFCEPFDRHEVDVPDMNPVHVNS